MTSVAAFGDDGRVPLTVRKVSASARVHENKIINIGVNGAYFFKLYSYSGVSEF